MSTAAAAETTREVLADLPGRLADLTAFYRDLHAHPERSWQEHRTAAAVAARLEAAGYDVTEKVGGTGVVGVLRNGDGPVVLLRADMDALPVAERTGLPYASTVPGVMHACGHDVHVTCLAGTAEALARHRSRWSGTLVVVAQPAEELGEGAQAMLADGLYTRFPRPDVVLGQHVGSTPAGTVVHRPGLLMSASTTLDVRIFGEGGHGASPELCVDPVVIAAHLVTRLQTIVSREVAARDSVVLTTGVLQAGSTANVIPDDAYLALNLRTQSTATRDRVLAAVRRIAEAECAAAGSPRPPEITTVGEFPLVLNDAAADTAVSAVHAALFGAEAVIEHGPLMGSEDFPYFGMAEHTGGVEIPALYWFIGGTSPAAWEAAPGETPEDKLRSIPGNHNGGFAPDADTAVPAGVTALTAAALTHLA